RLSELLALADIHLLPQRADAADLVLPSKLTGMLASGKPVVVTATENTELGTVVFSADCGLLVEPENPRALANVILQLAHDEALRTKMGAAGRKYAISELDAQAILGKFESELIALANRGRGAMSIR